MHLMLAVLGCAPRCPRPASTADCASCHSEQAAEWAGSHHRLALLPASESLADFSGARVGRWRTWTADGRRWVAAGEREFEVLHAVGGEAVQQHLVAVDGALTVLPIAWDVVGQRWFSLPQGELLPGDSLDWPSPAASWDGVCVACHRSQVSRHHDPVRGWTIHASEETVGCRACHMQGEQTVLDTCAPCHARRRRLVESPVGAFLDTHAPATLAGEVYRPDGGLRADSEAYVYGSFVQSAHFTAGLTCTDCHDPHRLTLTASCTDCHPGAAHPAVHPAADCVDCHMPQTVFMGVDPRRDHRASLPSARDCARCHDEGESWAAAARARLYPGAPSSRDRAAAIAAGRAGQPTPALQAMATDATLPPILRASAVSLSGELTGLSDPHPLVRAAAARRAAPAQAVPLLTDDSPLVRIAAALALPPERGAPLPAWRAAMAEAVAADFAGEDPPLAWHNLGVLQARSGELAAAQTSWQTAAALRPTFAPPILDLARLLARQGDLDGAQSQLRALVTARPELADAHYALGLLLAERGRIQDAAAVLARAAQLAPERADISRARAAVTAP